MPRITPFLWFDTQAEEAAELYTSIFERSRILDVTRRADAAHGEPGTALTVRFELDGQELMALNGGPQHFHFNESVSFVITCKDQAEIDHFWSRLTEGGEEGPCGWCKDRYGLSWQVVPEQMGQLVGNPDPAKAKRALEAMYAMKKLDIAALEAAAEGATAQGTAAEGAGV